MVKLRLNSIVNKALRERCYVFIFMYAVAFFNVVSCLHNYQLSIYMFLIIIITNYQWYFQYVSTILDFIGFSIIEFL